jgi:hypothetical protein
MRRESLSISGQRFAIQVFKSARGLTPATSADKKTRFPVETGLGDSFIWRQLIPHETRRP